MAEKKKEATNNNLPPEQRLAWILDKAIADPNMGIITFIGPTQQGKTHFIREYLKEHGLEIIMLNPQNDLPEDIGGWPMRKGGILSFTQPSAIPGRLLENLDSKWALYIDEGDKARDDTLSCLLTLLNPDERRLRETVIPLHVPIIMSMNERSTLPEPFVARCLFIVFPQEDMSVTTRPDLLVIKHFAEELCPPPKVSFPARPDTPGSLHKLVRWMKLPEFWKDEGIRWAIVRGLFSEKGATVVMSRLMDVVPKHCKEWAEVVKSSDLNENIIEILSAANYQEAVDVLTVLAKRANEDPTGELDKMFTAFLNTPKALYGVKRPAHLDIGKAALKEVLGKIKSEDAVTEKKK